MCPRPSTRGGLSGSSYGSGLAVAATTILQCVWQTVNAGNLSFFTVHFLCLYTLISKYSPCMVGHRKRFTNIGETVLSLFILIAKQEHNLVYIYTQQSNLIHTWKSIFTVHQVYTIYIPCLTFSDNVCVYIPVHTYIPALVQGNVAIFADSQLGHNPPIVLTVTPCIRADL